ncbi:MAG: putative peptide zinc metalloprotease protein [Acidobacteriota bacterium]|jgi:putative peptide zinc metalloprotease protein|nr:putative peptide zinc metalloprotease protein [Acidobacteriota bacterium]
MNSTVDTESETTPALVPELERRPQRVDPVQVTTFNSQGRRPLYVIKSEASGTFIRTNIAGVTLLNLLDGEHTIADLQRLLSERFNLQMSPEKIEQFVQLCQRNQLLVPGTWEEMPQETVAQRTRRFGSIKFYVRLVGGDRLLDWMVRHKRWWYNPVTAVAAAALLIAGVVFILLPIHESRLAAPLYQIRPDVSNLYLIFLPGVFVIEMCLHELSHGLACRVFGAKAGGFGVGLMYGILPVFYTDTTDAYSVDSKYKRALISAAGPMVDLAFLGIFALLYWSVPHETKMARFALAYTTFPLSSLLINLNPFIIRMDGYWILTDLLERPNLRRITRQYLREQVRRLFGRDANADSLAERMPTDWRWRMIYLTYGLISFAWTVVFLFLFARSIIMGIIHVTRVAALR